MMIFFMSFARIASDVNCKGSMWSLISCGMVTAMFILTYSIPRLMLVVTGNADRLVNGYPLNFADLGCVIFILFFVITTLRKGYSVEDIEKMNRELAAEAEKAEKIREAVNNVQVMAETGLVADNSDVIISKKISEENQSQEVETAETEE
jgi:urease gamma subunit